MPERLAARTPMQWSNEPQGGFTCNPEPPNPVISGGIYGYQHVNVADQRRDPNSLMNWMERMIRFRKETPEIGWGEFEIVRTPRRDVLALRYTWRGASVLVVHSFSADPVDLVFRSGAREAPDRMLVNILSHDHSVIHRDGKHHILMEPYGYRWFRIGGLDHLLQKPDI